MRRDLHDRGKQGERAAPRSAQSHTVVHYLANEVLHTPTVVLHRLVEPLFLEGQVPALPFCDDLPLPDVSLVPKTILPYGLIRACRKRSSWKMRASCLTPMCGPV